MGLSAGEIIRQEGRIVTGPNSRIEVEFPAATVRVGSNTDLSFTPSGGEMDLARGTLMVSARDEVAIRSGPVTVRTGRGDLELSIVWGHRVKVIVLDGKVRVTFAGERKSLRYGEMVEIPFGATEMPEVTAINLETLMSTSRLIGMGPLRSQRKLAKNAVKQNPRPVSLVNTPPGIAASRATATAGAAHAIEAQQAQQAQALVNQQILEDRRQQRLAEQAAARTAVQQAAQQLEAKRQAEAAEVARQVAAQQPQGSQDGGPQGSQGRGPQGNQGQGNNGNNGRPGRPDFGRPGRPGLPGPGLPGGPLGPPVIPP